MHIYSFHPFYIRTAKTIRKFFVEKSIDIFLLPELTLSYTDLGADKHLAHSVFSDNQKSA